MPVEYRTSGLRSGWEVSLPRRGIAEYSSLPRVAEGVLPCTVRHRFKSWAYA